MHDVKPQLLPSFNFYSDALFDSCVSLQREAERASPGEAETGGEDHGPVQGSGSQHASSSHQSQVRFLSPPLLTLFPALVACARNYTMTVLPQQHHTHSKARNYTSISDNLKLYKQANRGRDKSCKADSTGWLQNSQQAYSRHNFTFQRRTISSFQKEDQISVSRSASHSKSRTAAVKSIRFIPDVESSK